MDDALLMRGGQPRHELSCDLQCGGERQRSALESATERLASQQLGDEERGPVVSADVVEGDDVGVIQCAGDRASRSKRSSNAGSAPSGSETIFSATVLFRTNALDNDRAFFAGVLNDLTQRLLERATIRCLRQSARQGRPRLSLLIWNFSSTLAARTSAHHRREQYLPRRLRASRASHPRRAPSSPSSPSRWPRRR